MEFLDKTTIWQIFKGWEFDSFYEKISASSKYTKNRLKNVCIMKGQIKNGSSCLETKVNLSPYRIEKGVVFQNVEINY